MSDLAAVIDGQYILSIDSESPLIKLNKLTHYRKKISIILDLAHLKYSQRKRYLSNFTTRNFLSPIFPPSLQIILKKEKKKKKWIKHLDQNPGESIVVGGAKGIRKSGYAGVNARYGVARRGVLGLARGTTCHIGDTC